MSTETDLLICSACALTLTVYMVSPPQEDRDRGTNAAVNRMGTFPTCTRAWWREEFASLRDSYRKEVVAETSQAFKLAKERGRKTAAL